MSKGKFITLEGPEGSGKSTQAKMLADYLEGKGLEVIRTREPGGVSIAEQLRDILLNPTNIIYPDTELLLYTAGRAQHTQELILPALEKGKYVICERYTHASIAYQGYGRGLSMELINDLNKVATSGITPILTIILDIDADKGLKRVRESSGQFDRLEAENITFHERVREGYLKMADTDPKIIILDSTESKEKIHTRIIRLLDEKGLL